LKKNGYNVNTANIKEIRDHVIRQTLIKKEEFDSNLDIANVKNGLLNLKTGELFSHTRDYYSLNNIPVKYNPEAKAPKFEKFLSEVLYSEQIRTAKK
jgi:phage/plasmid-associated DNA primase